MAFGIPGSNTGSDAARFLGRMQFDARSGFFTNVDRVPGDDGMFENRMSDPYQGPQFAIDFGTFEVGYIKLSSPPAFLLVPFGQVIPAQPEELAEAKPGEKQRRAFSPGFRAQVMSSKTFGDPEPRYFSGTSKSLMGAMEELWMAFCAAPEAVEGRIPVVHVPKSKVIETKGPKGTTRNYAPVFTITSWITRPGGFGERTVPAPVATSAPKPQPAPVAQPAKPAPQPVAADAGDDLPF